ncbi:C-type lectin domain family 4 member G-like [Ornithorhynchus anatinus]|uniref:C-type lectin domain family 4 member G-like n=1 Tax=Ornithorhynchus anatinus TaxID=9258 RepID=UPI0004543581|nr:C-type lectin domain family 4 member G-like [Ornithorhynchus anatinus]
MQQQDGYLHWDNSVRLSLAEIQPRRAGSSLQLPRGWATLPLYLVLAGTLVLWGSLLGVMLAKASEMSTRLKQLQEVQNGLSMNASMVRRDVEELVVAVEAVKSNVTQELAQAGKAQEDLRSEMFRAVSALQRGHTSSCQPCPIDWKTFEGSCYFFSPTKSSWHSAKSKCLSEGSHLVIINDQQEQNFLTQNTNNFGYWIGLSDTEVEGKHKWIDGSDITFVYWNRGEPNDSYGREDCVMMLSHGHWNDAPCSSELDNWICEKRQQSC